MREGRSGFVFNTGVLYNKTKERSLLFVVASAGPRFFLRLCLFFVAFVLLHIIIYYLISSPSIVAVAAAVAAAVAVAVAHNNKITIATTSTNYSTDTTDSYIQKWWLKDGIKTS
jgi:hypothetical protein